MADYLRRPVPHMANKLVQVLAAHLMAVLPVVFMLELAPVTVLVQVLPSAGRSMNTAHTAAKVPKPMLAVSVRKPLNSEQMVSTSRYV